MHERASCKTSKIGTLSFRPKGEILINTLRYKIPHYVRNDTERYFARGSKEWLLRGKGGGWCKN